MQLLLSGQSVILAAIVLLKGRLRMMALLLLAFGAHMLANVTAANLSSAVVPDITSAFVFGYGPLIFFSIREITLRSPEYRIKDLMHGLPFLVALLVASPGTIFNLAALASIIFYLALTYRYIEQHQQAAKLHLPEAGLADLAWVKHGFWAIALIAAVDGMRIFLSASYTLLRNEVFFIGVLFSVFWVFLWLSINATRYRMGFDGWPDHSVLQIEPTAKAHRPLNPEETELAKQAMTVLVDQKFYLKPRLQLADLAQQLNVQPKQVSSLLFHHTGERFPKIVNRLRVEAAKAMIRETGSGPCNFLRISYDTGFNSKSSFNLVFKQITGLTPSAYRKSVQNQDTGRQ